MTRAPLVYIFGFPGVGKNTVARDIESRNDHFIAVQNHLISNAFRHVIAKQPRARYAALEQSVKHYSMKAWLNFLEFVEGAAPDAGLIFTSVLYQNDPDRVQFFDYIAAWADKTGRPFFPVRLNCSRAEILRRATSPNRNPEFKLTDTGILEKIMDANILLTPTHKNFLDIDVTNFSAVKTAEKILEFCKSI
jgi:hypothetical protein